MKTLCPSFVFQKLIVIFILLSGFFFACENNSNVSNAQISEIDFELVTLTENDVEATVFESGTDIKIALKLINNSDHELEWRHDYTCRLLQTEDFFLVHKLNDGNESDANYFPIGTPYQSPINCETINLPPQRIPPGESLIIKLSWSDNPSNEPLLKGKYYTISSFKLEIEGATRSWSLKTDFEIF